jgi:hypothetical protein
MNIRTVSSRGAWVRTAAVGLASLAVLGLWAPTAHAAPATPVPLDPSAVHLTVYPTYGDPATADSRLGGVPSRIAFDMVAYGGTLTFTLPAAVAAGPAFRVDLGLSVSDSAAPTRTYSTTSSVPADVLVVNDLGSKRYEVELPADDGVNGDYGFFLIYGLVPAPGVTGATLTTVSGVSFTGASVFSKLAFTAAPAVVNLPLGAVAENYSCLSDHTACPVTSVKAGASIDVTLPSSSRLIPLGLTDLRRSTVTLWPTAGGELIELSGTIAADGGSVAIDLPRGLTAQKYLLGVEAVGATGNLLVVAPVVLDLAAYNSGLRSNTGWGETEATAPADTSPLVPLGAGMILVAGVGTAVVLRRRTSPQE